MNKPCKKKFERNAIRREVKTTTTGAEVGNLKVRGIYSCTCGSGCPSIWGPGKLHGAHYPRLQEVEYSFGGASHVTRQSLLRLEGVGDDSRYVEDMKRVGMAATIGEFSIKHIKPETSRWLLERDSKSVKVLDYTVWQDTGFIFLVHKPVSPLGDVPHELAVVLKWAAFRGYSYLRLDSEGPVVENLEIWSWE